MSARYTGTATALPELFVVVTVWSKGDKPLPAGEATVEVDFAYAGGGAGKGASIALKVNGEKVGEGKMEATVGGRFGIDTFGIGEDTGQPVTTAQPPFKFSGEIEKVVIDVKLAR
jgi:hypothetical protein